MDISGVAHACGRIQGGGDGTEAEDTVSLQGVSDDPRLLHGVSELRAVHRLAELENPAEAIASILEVEEA